ncbi:MAG: hypothetical protein PF508_20225 [Spirochaeta sp.]|jgi:hypothetical protein|nr:hypothetical protein [Spirochaeta sp.]
MNVWDDLNRNISKTSQQWLSWAKQHAQELGDAGVRHVERQDLLSERKQLVHRIGDEVVNRFLVAEKKTLRPDSPEIAEHVERIRTIDERLSELGNTDDDTAARPESESDS